MTVDSAVVSAENDEVTGTSVILVGGEAGPELVVQKD
jgi:hypothetical protein